MISKFSRIHLLWVLLILFIVGIVLLVAPLVFMQPATVDVIKPPAQIHFTANQGTIIFPDECVDVTWVVNQISEIYINGIPEIGAGSREICITAEETPTMQVIFTDNSSETYSLPITILSREPRTWVIVGGLITLAILSVLIFLAPNDERKRGSRSWVRKIAIFMMQMSIGIFVSLFVVELGLRFYFRTFGSVAEQAAYVYSREEINAITPYLILLPGVDYGLSAEHPEHNQLGFRGEEITVPKPAGVFRIVTLGGSTTYGTSTAVDTTYPAYLQDILRDTYGYTQVEVVNGGVAGYTTFNTLVDFQFHILPLEPDLVIFYHAGNDILTRSVTPECYAGMNPLLGLDPRGRVGADRRNEPIPISTIYRLVAITLGWMPNPATNDGLFNFASVTCGDGVPRTNAENISLNPPVYYERNLMSAIGVAQIHNIPMMLPTWAYSEISDEALPHWREAVAEHNAINRELAETYDLLFLDYAELAPQSEDYWADYVHMNGAGSRHQAEAFAEYLISTGIFEGTTQQENP